MYYYQSYQDYANYFVLSTIEKNPIYIVIQSSYVNTMSIIVSASSAHIIIVTYRFLLGFLSPSGSQLPVCS